MQGSYVRFRAQFLRIWRGLVRDVVFGEAEGPRRLLGGGLRTELALLEPNLDEAFYLQQFPNPRFRAKAARAPALHYLLLGHHQGLSPHPAFDPRHYRQENAGVPRRRPYVHYLQDGRAAGLEPAPRLEPASQEFARPGALIIDHARGGGSSRFLDIYEARLREDGFRPIRTRRVGNCAPLYLVSHGEGMERLLLSSDAEAWIRTLRIERLVVNHLIDLPAHAFAWVGELTGRLSLDYELVLHDYYLACPRVNLVDVSGRYCGLAAPEVCRACLGADATPVDPETWRAEAAALLAGAVRTTAPSHDLAQRLQTVFPDARIEVFEPEIDSLPAFTRRPIAPDRPLRVLVIGALNRPKGFDVVLALAHRIRRTRAPIHLIVLGDSVGAQALRREGVEVLGRYREADVEARIVALAPDAAFFPAIWPETWSFTLSHALRAGVPIVAFDIGAIAGRLRRLGVGRILPCALSHDPDALLDALLRFREERVHSDGQADG